MSRSRAYLFMLSLIALARLAIAGEIIIIKEVASTPIDTSIKFDFTSNVFSSFQLGHDDFHSEIGLSAGVYAVTESTLDNWKASDIYCDLSQSTQASYIVYKAANGFVGVPAAFNDGDDSVRITLGANDTVICFFTNVFTAPPQPVCGNNIRETGEQCDDGNTNGGDGCSATCQLESTGAVCGNNIRETGEQCDDGNTNGGDGCSATCQVEITGPVCGNNIRETGEQCDDGNQNDLDACGNDCLNNYCGDGVVNNGEQCDGGDNCSATCRFIVTPTGCAHNVAYWKRNTARWPLHTLVLGTQSYDMKELAELLKSSEAGGDASVMLAQQLIAVLLNIANGAVETSEMTTAIEDAQRLLEEAEKANPIPNTKLPYNINSHTTLGKEMLDVRKALDQANQSNGPCRPVVTTADAGSILEPGVSDNWVAEGDANFSDENTLEVDSQPVAETQGVYHKGASSHQAMVANGSGEVDATAAVVLNDVSSSGAMGCSGSGSQNGAGHLSTVLFMLLLLSSRRFCGVRKG